LPQWRGNFTADHERRDIKSSILIAQNICKFSSHKLSRQMFLWLFGFEGKLPREILFSFLKRFAMQTKHLSSTDISGDEQFYTFSQINWEDLTSEAK
jgi:hypothetical protein